MRDATLGDEEPLLRQAGTGTWPQDEEAARVTDEAKQRLTVALPSGEAVEVCDDAYSDRLRCDHPEEAEDGAALARRLVRAASSLGRGRIVALVPESLAPEMVEEGLAVEGVMPGFYRGEADCAVLGLALDPSRAALANPIEVGRVEELLRSRRAGRPAPVLATRRARPEEAEQVAALLGATFPEYPTPSHDPSYVAEQIAEGTPFRVVEDGAGGFAACASADLVREARTAELTDCATRPDHRGRGLMKRLLLDLMDDLRGMGYPTAFTLARARIPGINLAFQRLGFELRGQMAQSCRIGEGLEDMNIWSRSLDSDVC